MKEQVPDELEKGRVITGRYASLPDFGFNGQFKIRRGATWYFLQISNGGGWEHLSVHIKERGKSPRLPTWEEMQMLRELVWRDDEVVVQIHPVKASYVNRHEFVLHLWRPIGREVPTPPMLFV